MSDAAFREKVFQQGVVVENLKDKDGKPAGISVTWADHHFWPSRLHVWGWVLAAIPFFLISWIAITSAGRGQEPSSAYFGLYIGGALLLGGVRAYFKQQNPRRHDTLRGLIIRPTGRLETPYGVPGHTNITWLYANYTDVTGMQVSPTREWDQHGDSAASYIMLQTVSGKPVFLGLTTRPKGEVQPIIVALHKAWETMRPTVEAHMAMAAAEAAMKSGATSFVVGDDGIKPVG